MELKTTREKIIEILREVLSASENRDWGRESHATKEEMKIMQDNNDRDLNEIADEILAVIKENRAEERKEFAIAYSKLLSERTEKLRAETIKEIIDEIESLIDEFEGKLPVDFLAEFQERLQNTKTDLKSKI